MGRHSIPEPDDVAGEPAADDLDEVRSVDDYDAGFDGESADGAIDPARYLRQRGYLDDDRRDETDQAPRRRGAARWQGGHRGAGGRRGVSVGVVAALITVIAVVGVVIAWRFFGSTLAHRSDIAAGRCVAGDLTVAVVADPSIADHLQEFADRFNKSAKPVGDRCVSVRIKPADSDTVIGGFVGDWPAQLGERPALWVPGSSVSTARLQVSAGSEIINDARSLVSSPVLLALRPQLKPALTGQGWVSLPGLQGDQDALGPLRLPGWGSLRLALPIDGNADAAFLAAEAVAAAAAPPGAPPGAGGAALRGLVDAQPKLADGSLAEAMNVLLRPDEPASAPVHAVITTEQQLFARGRSLPDAADMLAGWRPPGPVPVADYPTVLLNGSWLSAEQVSAASEFARFSRKADQLAELAKAGFRAQGTTPPGSEVTDFAALPDPLPVPDPAQRAALATILGTPLGGATVTVMLDQSMTTDEGGSSRLANVAAALDRRIQALPAGSGVGLWTFDGVEGRSIVPVGALDEQVAGQPRSAALTAGLGAVTATPGGAVSFTTLRLAYSHAQTNYRAGQNNSVLVITAGPHTDRTLDGSGLLDFIRAAEDPERPVAVNVIDFGGDPDQQTWQSVAQISGGRYQNLAGADSPDLVTALLTFLS